MMSVPMMRDVGSVLALGWVLALSGCSEEGGATREEQRAEGTRPSKEPVEAPAQGDESAAAEDSKKETDASAKSAKSTRIPELPVKKVAKLLERGDAVAVDANGPDVRSEYGVVPGARLLSSSSDYEPAEALPSDKDTKLVFYCANPQCSASDEAAERARNAGYTQVNIMRAGIMGWNEAGRDTADAPTS